MAGNREPRAVAESLVITGASLMALSGPAVLLATATSGTTHVLADVSARMTVNVAAVVIALAGLYALRRRLGVPVTLWRVGGEVLAAGLLVVILRQNLYRLLDLSPLFLNQSPLALQAALLATVPVTAVTAISETWLGRRIRTEQELRWAAYRALEQEERVVRERIFDELHGTVQTKLVLAATTARRLAESSTDEDVRPAAAQLHRDLESLRADDIRGLAHSLQPALIEAGLVPALRSLVARSQAPGRTVTLHGLSRATINATGILDRSQRLALYRVAEEGIANALKHASPTEITVRLAATESLVELVVTDNGSGPRSSAGGLGIEVLRARIAAFDGEVRFLAGPTGATLAAGIPRVPNVV